MFSFFLFSVSMWAWCSLSSSLTLSMSLLFPVFGLTSFPYLSHISMASLKPEMKPLTSFPESQKQREKKEKENKSRYLCPPEPGNLTRPLFRRTRLWFRICSSSAAIPREIKKRSEEASGLVLAINQKISGKLRLDPRPRVKGRSADPWPLKPRNKAFVGGLKNEISPFRNLSRKESERRRKGESENANFEEFNFLARHFFSLSAWTFEVTLFSRKVRHWNDNNFFLLVTEKVFQLFGLLFSHFDYKSSLVY